MEKTWIAKTSPEVCSSAIRITVEDGIVRKAEFAGGCPGNLLAVGRLVSGMPVEQVIAKLSGIRCGRKATSCADQLARALAAELNSDKKQGNR